MKSRIFINLLSMVFITCILFVATPVRAQEPVRETPLALKVIDADDLESAVDDETSQSPQPKAKALKQKDNPPQSPQPEATEQMKDESPKSLEQKVEI